MMLSGSDTPHLNASIGAFSYETAPNLTHIDLSLCGPALVALIGPNGSGKTTLLRILSGHLAGPGTDVRIDGRPLSAISHRRRAGLISWVPQRAEPVFAATVRDLLQVGMYRLHRPLRPLPRSAEAAMLQVAERVGIYHLLERQVDTLSGGEYQRALIGRALAQRTPVMILDEPVANLDIRYQEEIYRLLRAIADAGRLVVVADHHIDLSSAYVDRLLAMSGGTIVADGPPSRVLSADLIQNVFGVHVEVFADPATGTPRLSRPTR